MIVEWGIQEYQRGYHSMIRRYFLSALFLFVAIGLPGGAGAADDLITVYKGEVRILQMKSEVDRVAVGNGELLSTSLLENGQLLLLAEGEGETNVHIWYSNGQEQDFKVHIEPKDSNRVVHELRVLLSDLEGVQVRQVGERIFLTGTITEAEKPVLDTVTTEYQNVMNLTRMSSPPPQVLPRDKMIYMDVRITEFSTNKLEDLGIDWSNPIAGPSAGVVANAEQNPDFSVSLSNGNVAPSFAGALGPLSGPAGFFGIATEITSRLNFLISTGDAVILAQPKLSARSGGEAEFLAGGEVPIPVTGTLGSANVEFKEFGISLNISPVVDHLNNIVAKVATEVSAIDQSNAVQGIPGFLTRKTSTDVSMRDGQTLVISGLVSQELGKDVNKLSFLGDIPILGALFRSNSWRNRETELVIFVTPTVYDTESQINRDAVDRSRQLKDKYNERVKREGFIILD